MAWTTADMPTRMYRESRVVAYSEMDKKHPTQKPLKLMTWCLSFFPKAETILDPYMGTGTTGVAAVQMNKRFVGIERERKYFEIACRRIDQATREPRLDLEPPAKAKQEGLAL